MPTATAHPTTPPVALPTTGRTSSSRRLPFERRRQLPWVAGGVALIVGCALLFAVISQRGSAAGQVLVVTSALPAGHVLTAADLTTTSLRGDTVASISAAEEGAEVGRPLAVPLVAGALLTPAAVGSGPAVLAGQAVVGLALKAGQYPPMLGPGDQIQIINTAPASSTTSPTAAAIVATVVGTAAAPEGSAATEILSVQVNQADAATVAQLGAAGQASVVLLPSGVGSS